MIARSPFRPSISSPRSGAGRGITRPALALALTAAILASCSDAFTPVDRGLVGTWEVMVPNTAGVARWVWDIHADGSYAFHAEGPGDVPAHSGEFEARDGAYHLRSTTMVWVDSGTYQLTQPSTMRATGILGTASWKRVRQGDTRSDSILTFLGNRPLVAGMLEPPFVNPRTEVAGLNAEAQNDGVIGIVRTVAQSPYGPGAISARVYRDLTSAQAAYAMDALYDSKTFRIPPGQVVNSRTYTRLKSEGRCLSRVQVNSAVATVSCYLLVDDPSREPVMIVSEHSEARTGTSGTGSDAVYERAAGLLTAGIRYWTLSNIAMELGGTRR